MTHQTPISIFSDSYPHSLHTTDFTKVLLSAELLIKRISNFSSLFENISVLPQVQLTRMVDLQNKQYDEIFALRVESPANKKNS
jgi:hypothetical protein